MTAIRTSIKANYQRTQAVGWAMSFPFNLAEIRPYMQAVLNVNYAEYVFPICGYKLTMLTKCFVRFRCWFKIVNYIHDRLFITLVCISQHARSKRCLVKYRNYYIYSSEVIAFF